MALSFFDEREKMEPTEDFGEVMSFKEDLGLLIFVTLFAGIGAVAGTTVGARLYRRLFLN
jgi:hypothetical protein